MILPFDKISKNDANKAGGKWASLGEMTQAGIAIPPGFVVLAETFEEFVDSNNLRAEIQTILGELDHNNVGSIEHASEKIQELIRWGIISETIQKEIQKYTKTIKTDFVAVRSSATAEDWAEHAWAWQLDTYLNVPKTDIVTKIQSCWASLFTPRALFYRSEKWLGDLHISVAVVVQSMVDAESAGVAFSVHPVTENTDEIVIEWSWWLGEAVVSGEVTPDSFVISKSSWEIISEHIAEKKKGIWRNMNGENEWRDIENRLQEKPILTKKELSELSQLIITIENHYEFPCDIEWAHSKGRIYILQARPITTLKNIHPKKTILTESFTREFSLIQIQMWWRRYTKKFLETKIKSLPIYVFKYRDGLVTAYRSEENQKILINPIIRKKINQDTKFLQKYYEKQMNNIKNIEIILQKKSINTLDLKKYLQKLYDFWQLHYITQFLPLDFNLFTEDERNYALKIRSKIDKKIHYLWWWIEILCKKIYPEMNDLIRWLTWDEVTIWPLPSIDELENRKKIGVILYNDRLVDEKELDILKIKYSFEIQDTNLGNSVTGEIASHGKIQWIVKVIMKKEDLQNFKKDEVFVSYMTMPNFESAYSQACAIVTDEGGITSHAAIISRELKIPCIIGTKNATKILKDGDLVEVDAENGVVKILEKTQSEEWVKNVTREVTIFPAASVTKSFGKISKPFEIDFDYEHILFVWNTWYYRKSDYEKLKDILIKKIQEDTNYVQHIAKKQKEVGESLKKFVQKLNSMKISKKNIASHLRGYDEKMTEFYAFWWIAIPVGEILEMRVRKILEDHSEIDFDELMFVREELELVREKRLRNEIAIQCQKYKKYEDLPRILEQKLIQHAEQFGWINTSYHVGVGLSARDFFEKIQAENPEESREEMLEQRKREKNTLTKLKKHLSKEDQSIIESMQTIMYLRNYQKETVNECQYKSEIFLRKIAQEIDLEWDTFLAFSSREIKEFIENKLPKKGYLQKAKKRQKEFVIEWVDADVYVYEEGLEKYFKKVAKNEPEQTKTIQWSPAYKWKTSGTVRVIHKKSDIELFIPGEILVTNMTSIDYVHIMGRASAIITNEGGITCHAAIFSRELRIPCIIGTKNATEILKTGDFVEVDAENGVVNILDK